MSYSEGRSRGAPPQASIVPAQPSNRPSRAPTRVSQNGRLVRFDDSKRRSRSKSGTRGRQSRGGIQERLPAGRYLWHRALRILPGYWVCLLVVGLVVAPSVALVEHVTVRGTVTAPDGSLAYVLNNCCLAIRQSNIGGLLLNTPFGRMTGQKAFDGSLWTLMYEALCYLAVAALAATAILRPGRPRYPVRRGRTGPSSASASLSCLLSCTH